MAQKLLKTKRQKVVPKKTADGKKQLASAWSPVIGMTPEQEKIASIVMSVADFGRRYELSTADAYAYLNKYEGLAFLDEHYSASRCYSEEMMSECLDKVCRNHGGVLT